MTRDAPSITPAGEASPLPWAAEDVRVCLIGYHGALHELATALTEGGIGVAAVVSHIDDSTGKTGPEVVLATHGLFPSMAEIAATAGAPLLHLSKPNTPEAINKIRDTGANVVLSVSAPILTSEFLDVFDGWAFNFHGSRHYRGRGGLSWNILNGIVDDTVILHWMDRGIDSGDFIDEEPFSWSEGAYPIDLFQAQRSAYGTLTERWIDMVRTGRIPRTPQDTFRPYLPSLITDTDGWINWTWVPKMIERVVRAFGWPYMGASSLLEGASRGGDATRVHIGRCRVVESPEPALHPIATGSVLFHDPQGSAGVACGGGGVLHIETLREGDEEIPAGEHIKVGMRMRNRT